MDNNVLVPVQQALIPFHGSEILAVRLPDDRVAASLNSLCKMLNLARHGQMERIRRDKNLTEYLLLIRVETMGGPQRTDVLIAEAVPSWVMGVQVEHLAPEKRPLILALKVEVVHVLYRYFFGPDVEQAAPQTSEPQVAPPAQPAGDTVGCRARHALGSVVWGAA